MTQYIDKSALVTEIEKLKEMYCYDTKTNSSFVAEAVINSINNAINSIEVKELDLEKEFSYEDYISFFKEHPDFSDDWGFDEAWVFAKHFFELGLKASNPLTWKDIETIGELRLNVALEYRKKELGSKSKFPIEDYCKEVLKRFNAQKGEKI